MTTEEKQIQELKTKIGLEAIMRDGAMLRHDRAERKLQAAQRSILATEEELAFYKKNKEDTEARIKSLQNQLQALENPLFRDDYAKANSENQSCTS